MDYAFADCASKIFLLNTKSQRFYPMFTFRIITILGVIFISRIHFKLIFYGMIKGFCFLFVCKYSTADGDCSHEIKRRLLLGRKVMTNLDSIFKSRDITLPTKVCLVKAMVFPVVMYGCESWTVKKAER